MSLDGGLLLWTGLCPLPISVGMTKILCCHYSPLTCVGAGACVSVAAGAAVSTTTVSTPVCVGAAAGVNNPQANKK
jgi:hypothetical protein